MGRFSNPVNPNAHRSKVYIEQRKAAETIIPFTGEIIPPKHLTVSQQKQFIKLATQMSAAGLYTDADTSQLALYVIEQECYIKLSSKLDEMLNAEPMDTVAACKISDMTNKSFKNLTSAAQELGLTPLSRRKLNINITATEPEPLSGIALFMSNREKDT